MIYKTPRRKHKNYLILHVKCRKNNEELGWYKVTKKYKNHLYLYKYYFFTNEWYKDGIYNSMRKLFFYGIL